MKIYKQSIAATLLILVLATCGGIYMPKQAQYYDYRINEQQKTDTTITVLLKKYSDSINKTMNFVIATASETLVKKQPNGSLGLVVVNAMREGAAKAFNTTVDAAFVNNGGIRIPSLAKGNITVGKVYEIMPFDNLIVLQKLTGEVLNQFIQLTAKRGGWPMSGITYNLLNGKAINIMVGGKALNLVNTYTIANSDYIANGGDDAEMLRNIPQLNNNILIRNVLLDYFKKTTLDGNTVDAPITNPITLQ